MRVWLEAPPPPMVPVPMARRLVRMPVRPRTTSSCARCLPLEDVSARAAVAALLATQVAASPEAVRRRKSLRSIDTPLSPEYARVQRGCERCERTCPDYCGG